MIITFSKGDLCLSHVHLCHFLETAKTFHYLPFMFDLEKCNDYVNESRPLQAIDQSIDKQSIYPGDKIINTVISWYTSKPLGIVFDRAESRAISQTPVDDSVDSEEIRHRTSKQVTLWVKGEKAKR